MGRVVGPPDPTEEQVGDQVRRDVKKQGENLQGETQTRNFNIPMFMNSRGPYPFCLLTKEYFNCLKCSVRFGFRRERVVG